MKTNNTFCVYRECGNGIECNEMKKKKTEKKILNTYNRTNEIVAKEKEMASN